MLMENSESLMHSRSFVMSELTICSWSPVVKSDKSKSLQSLGTKSDGSHSLLGIKRGENSQKQSKTYKQYVFFHEEFTDVALV